MTLTGGRYVHTAHACSGIAVLYLAIYLSVVRVRVRVYSRVRVCVYAREKPLICEMYRCPSIYQLPMIFSP